MYTENTFGATHRSPVSTGVIISQKARAMPRVFLLYVENLPNPMSLNAFGIGAY